MLARHVRFLVVFLASALLTSCAAFGAVPAKKVRRPVRARPAVQSTAPLPSVEGRGGRPLGNDYPVPQYMNEGRSAPVSSTLKSSIPDAPPTRIVHVRFNLVPLVAMVAGTDTVGAFRVDVDLIAGEKFSLGPSVSYRRGSTLDPLTVTSNTPLYLETSQLEVGLVGNVYFVGTTHTGGLLFRPHAYWVSVSGEKQDGNSAVVANGRGSDGVRAGAEILFQKVLDPGFSFEVGGGFTYHVLPYSVAYDGVGSTNVGPENRFSPTVTVGVGWAF